MTSCAQSLREPPPARPALLWLRRIGCVSTSRADSGILRPLLRALATEGRWDVVCLAGGTHHSDRFGRTIDELHDVAEAVSATHAPHNAPRAGEAPGNRREPRIKIHHLERQAVGDAPHDVATTAGRAVVVFSEALAETKPDLVIVVGDRTEMLAAALAALIHRVPICHLHGGETTLGAYDEQCRHAITKLAHVHFAALPGYAARIRTLGEEEWRIHTVGALALDGLAAFKPEPIDALSDSVKLDFAQPTTVVAYHPETLAERDAASQIGPLLAALGETDDNLLFIGVNADVGHDAIRGAVERFVARRPRARLVPSLSQHRFWSCLAHARLLVGNSSAGIIEAASFGLPAVNVGDRQAGRVRPANVIDAPTDAAGIRAAIARAQSRAFRDGLTGLVNPYGDGRAAERIVSVLRGLPPRSRLLVKRPD